jgi:hypothetical protein
VAKKAQQLLKLLPLIFLSGCPTRQEIKANLWLNSGLPADLCKQLPEIKKYGMYRRLNDDVCRENGKAVPCYELQAYCNPQSQNYFSVLDTTLDKMLDAYLPKGGK